MAHAPKQVENEIQFLDEDEAHAFFDEQARQLAGMSGPEFLRRYDAGEFEDQLGDDEDSNIMQLVMLSSFGR